MIRTIEKDIEQLIKKILLDLRPEKKINKDNFDTLYLKIEEYKNLIKDQESLSRSITGVLFYFFSTLVFEAQYIHYDEKIMKEVFRFRIALLNVFDEKFLN